MEKAAKPQRWQSIDRKKREAIVFWAMAAAAAIAMAVYLSITCRAMLYSDDNINVPAVVRRMQQLGPGGVFLAWLQSVWDGMCFREGRFFPLGGIWHILYDYFLAHIVTYRLYIIAVTCATGAVQGTLLACITGSRRMGLACFALTPLMFCLWLDPSLNGMYTFSGLPQRALLAALLAAHCMVKWARTRHWRWAVLGAFFMFFSCGTYEIGYTYIFVCGFLALLLHDRFWDSVCTGLPLLAGELLALFFYIGNVRNAPVVHGSVVPSLDPGHIALTTLQQMWGGFPHTEMLVAGVPFPAGWTAGDLLTSLVLAAVGVGALAACRATLTKKQSICLFLAGFCMLLGPSFLIGLTRKYQNVGWVTWERSYIPNTAEAFGTALMLVTLLQALLQWMRGKKQLAGAVRLAVCGGLVLALTVGGVYQRAATRVVHPADEAYNYELVADAIKAGIAAPAGDTAPIVCDFDYWGRSPSGPKDFFKNQAELDVNAWLLSCWENEPHGLADTVYRMGLYGNYGGYTTVWFGRAEDETLATLADVRVFVDANRIPDTAVLKYSRRAQDGSETAAEIPLAALPHLAQTENGCYIVELPDDGIVAPKVMIWAG